jgi:uncharacterized protein
MQITPELTAKCAYQSSANALDDDKNGIPVPSPCISVCKMTEDRSLCIGCLRTLDELRAWSTLPDVGKRAVWGLIANRMMAI